MNYRGLILACGCLTALAAGAENTVGRTIGSACFGCHGAAGANETSIPPVIVGVPAPYIATALREFRDGSRTATIMDRIARGFTDREIDAVAGYIAGLARD
jgi:sulfide dehydrogenase cytochrome subunit